jgi:hypothetical protein
MRAIIIAAGDATRWANHLGTKKHLVKVDNEPIIYRTVRLLLERGVTDIYIVGPDENEYKIPGTKLFIPEKNPKNHGVDKFLNSEELWNKEGRTIVCYGDVFFTDAAMDSIVNYTGSNWTLFCRFGGSEFTGSKYGECFAQSFYPNEIDLHKEKLLLVVESVNKKHLKKSGGWEHYRAMNNVVGRDLRQHNIYEKYFLIDDFTEDFDFPEDYDRFIKRWEEAKSK